MSGLIMFFEYLELFWVGVGGGGAIEKDPMKIFTLEKNTFILFVQSCQ